VGISLSQFVAASQPGAGDSQPLQQGQVTLEFLDIPMFGRHHPLYRWTRSFLTRTATKRC